MKLTYRVYAHTDTILKEAEIQNQTRQTLRLESTQSGVWYVRGGDGYCLSYLADRWAGDTQLIREPIHQGKIVLESRRGNTNHRLNPWFPIDEQVKADEEHNRAWFGAIGWSGNWKLSIEQTPASHVRVAGGYNDFDFDFQLKAGESWSRPPLFRVHRRGIRAVHPPSPLHRFERDQILPERSREHLRPVLYNSWEATFFNVDEAVQKELAGEGGEDRRLAVRDARWLARGAQ